jgi:hypothetical protein
MTLVIKAAATKGGKILTKEVPNFPINMAEAVERFGEDAVYADFVRNFTIKVQGKMRAEYTAPNTTGKTKSGSAIAQVLAARTAARIAELNAAANEESNEESNELNEE